MGAEGPRHYFMDNQRMDFETQCILGSCSYGSAEVGEVLSTAEHIVPGDFDSWVDEWLSTPRGRWQSRTVR